MKVASLVYIVAKPGAARGKLRSCNRNILHFVPPEAHQMSAGNVFDDAVQPTIFHLRTSAWMSRAWRIRHQQMQAITEQKQEVET
ncbi:hypothetical protein HFO27_33940 [Rhizobium leguminosarum]|uniref:hypothetical protein n=1 Tax=Rhizobium leguminosarum TaxID=384 RepID=UPI001C913E89|nr:hypothetical protein [Rhizobium leguminosarum]MBY3179516.1 hypothetical protein [Rhizobium leguminosarum]MBY5646660.1 hypothetical protein [Rhizobium leguminosarum]